MIKYFSINDISRYLAIILCFTVIRVLYLIVFSDPFLVELHFGSVSEQLNNLGESYAHVQHNIGPFSTALFRAVYTDMGAVFMPRVFAWILGIIQIVVITSGLNAVGAYNSTNLFTGIIYSVILHLFPDMVVLSPLLLGMTLMCFVYIFILRIIREQNNQDYFLYVGLLTGLAGGFLFPMFLFFFPTLVIIVIYTRFDKKSISLYLFGMILPVLLLLSYYQYDHRANFYLNQNFYFGFSVRLISQLPLKVYVLVAFIPTVLFALSFSKILGNNSMVTARQKMLVASVFYLITCIIILILLPDKSVYYYLLFVPFLPIFYGILFIEHDVPKRANGGFIFVSFLLLLIPTLDSIPYIHKRVNYESLYAKQVVDSYGKVLNLSDDKNILFNNTYATGFCEYMIAKKYFDAQTIESTVFVYKMLLEDLPDAIYDPNEIVAQKMNLMPDLKKKYWYQKKKHIWKLRER